VALSAPPDRTRIGAALAAAAVEFALAAGVIWGLAAHWTASDHGAPSLVTITPSVQPIPPPPPAPAADQGAAAAPNRKSEALPVAAPSPPVVLATPRPAATLAAKGNEASAGAAAVTGPGSGADGSGAGTGSGEGGFGAGSGAVTTPVRVAGALSDRDYPRRSRASGTVAIAFRVRGDGRVDRCAVIASSGEALLDDLTCELVERRFRYRPARDAAGRPVDSMLRTSFTWGTRLRD
jgi:protein TonB